MAAGPARELAFPVAEYAARVEAARRRMHAAGLDALLIGTGPNLAYLSGYPSPASSPSRPFLLLVPREEVPALVVQDGRLLEARRLSWVEDVRSYGPLSHLPVALLTDLLRARGLDRAQVGLDRGEEMTPAYPAEELGAVRAGLPGLAFRDAAGLLWALRLVKSPREADLVRRACAVTTAAYARCLPRLRPGMTEKEAAVLFAVAHLEAGGDQPRAVVTSGPDGYGLASKPPGSRRLLPGDLVWFDVGCSVGGYHSDFSRAAVLGPVSDRRWRAQDVVNQATRAGIDAVRPGVPVAAVARACYRVLEAAGLPVTTPVSRLGGRAGHGLGLLPVEPPSVSETDPTVLQAGMVVTVEPSVATADGLFHHEHDVLVTEDGAEVLSAAPVELFEVR